MINYQCEKLKAKWEYLKNDKMENVDFMGKEFFTKFWRIVSRRTSLKFEKHALRKNSRNNYSANVSNK